MVILLSIINITFVYKFVHQLTDILWIGCVTMLSKKEKSCTAGNFESSVKLHITPIAL